MTDKVSLSERIDLLTAMGNYMLSGNEAWQVAKEDAGHANAWFTSEHIERAIANIAHEYLQKDKLQQWIDTYPLPASTKTVGIVMAGNIPLVGFHDFLCGFVSGHNLLLKLSSKDEILPKHLVEWLLAAAPALAGQITIAERLNGCDAYIATGSNNTARYFEQYFGKYPNIIRSNRTSVAILDGTETDEELSLLADDVYLYYGLGCRNVTQICVPKEYDFARLLRIFNRYSYYADLNKYKNNYDYHLAIYLLNRVQYMSNESLLMVENELPFSAVSVLHYRFYDNESKEMLLAELQGSNDIQAIIGKGLVPFGSSQKPALNDYADGADTMAFLCGL
ncbi:MAG: acyl-CoA reductase [Taibaiella sp.]|nr:acyl-CoA reductase [Taibaiella sp.]